MRAEDSDEEVDYDELKLGAPDSDPESKHEDDAAPESPAPARSFALAPKKLAQPALPSLALPASPRLSAPNGPTRSEAPRAALAPVASLPDASDESQEFEGSWCDCGGVLSCVGLALLAPVTLGGYLLSCGVVLTKFGLQHTHQKKP